MFFALAIESIAALPRRGPSSNVKKICFHPRANWWCTSRSTSNGREFESKNYCWHYRAKLKRRRDFSKRTYWEVQ